MNEEGRVCDFKRQLMTTGPLFRWVKAVSVARVGAGADAQAVAATDSRTAMRTARGTATRFMVSSLATIVLLLRRRAAELVASIAPDLLGGLDDEAELGHLLVVGQRVALGGRGEAALAGQADLVQRHVLGGFVDAALEVVLGLQLRALGGDQAEDDHLAGRDEAQRLEAAGALVVVLQEEAVHVQLGEQGLGHEVVTTGGDPTRAEVATAHV